MVAPDLLQNPLVQKWLGSVQPAWTLLTAESFNALRTERLALGGALRLSEDLAASDVVGSAILQNAAILLQHALDGSGLKLTATGNLTRAAVAELIPKMDWPAYDKADLYRCNKVINESDFLPLHVVRTIAGGARLLRSSQGRLVVTKAGRDLLPPERHGSLFAVLFRHTFWRQDLSYFGRGLLGAWPQADIGLVLWSLSVSADAWQSPETLARLCAVPIDGVVEADWDVGSTAMEARILRPLLWFGLVEYRCEQIAGSRFGQRHFYRKAPLFDRALRFNVAIEVMPGSIQ